MGFSSLLPSIASADLSPERNSQNIKPSSGACRKLTLFDAIATQDANCIRIAAQGMDLDAWDSEGKRPLHRAAEQDSVNAILALVELGADIHALDQNGRSPRIAAKDMGAGNAYELLEKLAAETERLELAISANDLERVRGSLSRGVALGARNSRYDTVLHHAAESGFTRIGQALLRAGANIRARNYLGNTPLHEAILANNSEFAAELLAHNAPVNAENERRETPLDLACLRGMAKIQLELAKLGAKKGKRMDLELGLSFSEGEGNYPSSTGTTGGGR